jgi:ABC-type uncharacterized transport system permease subunit
MLLAGAFTGALVGSPTSGWGGLFTAVIVGGHFGLLLAVLAVTYRATKSSLELQSFFWSSASPLSKQSGFPTVQVPQQRADF